MDKEEYFTEEDLDNCWGHHYKAFFIDVLNGEYKLSEARKDLKSLIGSRFDKRETGKERKFSHDFLEAHGFTQLGNRPIWSNIIYQLHQYPENWGVFKRGENNVLYEDTGISLKTCKDFTEWYTTQTKKQ